MTRMSRRRFLTVSAACAALPAIPSSAQTARWQGTALGASASLRLEGLTDTQAAPIIAAVEAELERLELIFSLYRTESELTRLNGQGFLNAPSPELLSVLSLCSALHDATAGPLTRLCNHCGWLRQWAQPVQTCEKRGCLSVGVPCQSGPTGSTWAWPVSRP